MRFSEELPSSSSVVQQQQCNRMMPRLDANRQTAASASSTSAVDGNSSICRNLFGPVDHEENARFLSDQLSCMKKEARLRWNFDFESGTPIPGRFEWTPVLLVPADDSPTRDNPGDNPNAESKVKRDQDVDVCQTTTQQQPSQHTRPLLRQTKITDHMPKQKRSRPGFQDAGDRLLARTTSKTHLTKRPKLLQTASNVLESEWTQPGGQMNEAV